MIFTRLKVGRGTGWVKSQVVAGRDTDGARDSSRASVTGGQSNTIRAKGDDRKTHKKMSNIIRC